MTKQLLDGPSSVVDAIKKYKVNHEDNNPTRAELIDIAVHLGNTIAECNEYIEDAITAQIVDHDKVSDTLTIADIQSRFPSNT